MHLPIDTVLKKMEMNATGLAERLGLDKSTVYRWRYSKKRGGTDGIIPLAYWGLIQEMSGGKVKQEDFLPQDV